MPGLTKTLEKALQFLQQVISSSTLSCLDLLLALTCSCPNTKKFTNVMLYKTDASKLFAMPVTEDEAPGYFSIIHQPMDFVTLRKKLKEGR